MSPWTTCTEAGMLPNRCVTAAILLLAMARPASAEQPLTWEDCARLAKEHNPDMIAAGEQVKSAEAAVSSARADLRPQFSLGASRDQSKAGAESGDQNISYGVTLSVEQSLYSGGRKAAAIKEAEADLEGTREDAAMTEAEVAYALRTAFVELLYAQEQIGLLLAIKERRAENLELVDLRYKGGREHEGSLALSRAALYEAETDLTQAGRAIGVSRRVLTRVIGRSEDATGLSVTGELGAISLPGDTNIAGMIRHVPGFLRYSAAKSGAEARLDGARSAFRPDVSLRGSVSRHGDEYSFDENSWSAGLSVSYPLWSGGRDTYAYRQAEAGFKKAEANLASAANEIETSLLQAANSVKDSIENMAVQKKYLEASEIRAEISRKQYENGLLTFENWDIIENSLITNRKLLLDAQKRATLAEASWLKAVGKGLQ